jgi:hypothetical protein
MATSSAPHPGGGFQPTPFKFSDLETILQIPADNLFYRGRKPAPYSREHWFIYFWKEAKEQSWAGRVRDPKGQVLQFFNRAFEKTEGWPDLGQPLNREKPPIKPKGDFASLFHDPDFCSAMEVFLKCGFEWYTAQGSSEGGTEHLRYMRLIDRTVGFEIRWRGESSRDLQTVIHDGYSKQALIPMFRTKYNLGAAWHPFSKPDNSSKFWYRKGNGDNDWYTVVAIALDWRVSLGFPKIEQTPELRILQPNQTIDEKFAIRHPDLIGRVEFADGQKEWRMITRSKIALLLLDTMYFDTQGKQRGGKTQEEVDALKEAEKKSGLHYEDPGFPEQGTGLIAGRNVMGMVEFLRVHHGHCDASGYSAVLDLGKSRQLFKNNQALQSEPLAALGSAEAAREFQGKLQTAWADATRQQVVHLKWVANGYERLQDPARTRGIRSITMGGDRIY